MVNRATRQWQMAFGLVLALVWAGCGLLEPESSEPKTNQAPETVLTAVPPDTTTHCVQFYWTGWDPDGVVLYFETKLDGGEWDSTTATDIEIFLEVQDTTVHTFSVRAYDDDGAVDPDPPEKSFTATNIAPETQFITIPDNELSLGPAFTFECDAEDVDDRTFFWRYHLDEGEWSAWQADSTFAFGDSAWVANALGLLPGEEHTFYAQAKDLGGLEDLTPISVTFVVDEDAEPVVRITGVQANTVQTYSDYSIFSDPDGLNDVIVAWNASASEYQGAIAGFAYIWVKAESLGTATFTDWGSAITLDLTDVTPGEYWFIVKAIDTAGHEDATPESALVWILDPLGDPVGAYDPDAILVLNETRDGAGVPGSPNREQLFEYYDEMLGGRTYEWVDYEDLFDAGTNVTPAVAGKYGLIIWIDDDSNDHFIFKNEENMRFVRDYAALTETYSLGGATHLVLSHWNMLGDATMDSLFVANLLGVTDKVSNVVSKTFAAADGQGPLDGSTLTVDEDKLPGSFQGKLNKVWAMTEPEEATVLTTWVSAEPDTMDGLTNAYCYYPTDDFGVVVTGYPLYFMKDAPVFMEAVLGEFGF